jgi:hypothetical protein
LPFRHIFLKIINLLKMKKFRFLATAFAAIMTLLLVSCGSGENKKTEVSATDTSKTNTTESTPEKTPDGTTTMPKHIVIVRHKVANFSKWKMGYEGHDSARRAAGLTNYGLARGAGKDSNTVMIFLKADNIVKAKEFASSTDLADVMKKSGVTGPRVINYIDVVMDDNSQISQTDRVMVTHKVKDWYIWKRVFDSHKQARIDAGLIDRGLGHTSGDTHNVSAVFAITDMAKAKAFIASKDLKDKMAEAGVEGPPTFFYYNIVQMY